MSELTISSKNWLAISLRNGAAIVFNLTNPQQWQYLQSIETKENHDGDLNRNLIQFTPNGEKLIINGQNKQIYIYIQSNESCWQLQRTITVKKRASALDTTNELLIIADKSGDVYKINLLNEENLILTDDDCLMGHLSMLLDIKFLRTNENQDFLITADRDEKIRLSYYPNAYNIQGYCLGHREFVSHVKLIDQNRIISASGDGTLRLWDVPDCVELNVFPMKSVISSSEEIFYGAKSSYDEPESSPMNESIWKLDLCPSTETFLALSIYAYRNHSIYLTTLSNFEYSTNQIRKLTFDSKYGIIIDYTFSPKGSSSDLYILFDSNTLLKINVQSILSSEQKEFSEEVDLTINEILAKTDYNLMDNIHSLEVIFKQLFKTRGELGESSYYKRKNERIEQQEEKKRQKQIKT